MKQFNGYMTRWTVIAASVILACSGCKKSDGLGNSNSQYNYTKPPPASPITSNLGVYSYNNYQPTNPMQVSANDPGGWSDLPYQADHDGFFISPITMDQYRNWVQIQTQGLAFFQYKGFTASSGQKNYAGFKFLNFVDEGHATNLGGETTINLPGNGTLHFPSEAFNSLHIDETYELLVNYLDPSVDEFAVSLPSLPFADSKNRRLFLESYGVYQIKPILTSCNCVIGGSVDYFAKEVTLDMPIPADRVATAPDSIEAWHLDPGFLWEQDGMAYKKGAFYEKNIREHGIWNFAKPRDAVYITLQLRTTNEINIPNTRFLVKDNTHEVAEGRTDMDGNALILVPANDVLKFNITDDHFANYLNIQMADQELGSFSKATEKKIVLPDRMDIGTLEGNVYNCDGSSFGNGYVVISQSGAKDSYVAPIKNGVFQSANWIGQYFPGANLTFYTGAGDSAFQVNTCLSGSFATHLKRMRENFYSCPNAGGLYCNYQVDGGPNTSITGNVSQSTPTLTATRMTTFNIVTIQDGNKGISFPMWLNGGYDGVLQGDAPFILNNVVYQFGDTRELAVYRYDNVANGFIEGWFGIDYVDGATSHVVTGNFRVKII